MMRLAFVVTLVVLSACATPQPVAKTTSSAASTTTLSGQLDRKLVELDTSGLVFFKTASQEAIDKLPAKLALGEKAFMGDVPRAKPVPMMLVESAAQRVVWIAGNRYVLSAAPVPNALPYQPQEEGVLIEEDLPAGGFVSKEPLHFVRKPVVEQTLQSKRKPRKDGAEERILFMGSYLAEGTITIEGRQTRVGFPIDPTGKAWERDYFIDANGNGKLDPLSPLERGLRKHKESPPVVTRVGTTFIALSSLDPVKGNFTFERRPEADYLFAEPKVGRPMPDFSFADLDGKTHRLSELRGKYVLVDFWATWCGPCRTEMPNLRAAYEQYRTRNFEIVGISEDEDIAALRSYVEKEHLTWPQTGTELSGAAEVKRLVEDRLRIQGLPTQLLVDPQGNIAMMWEDEKRPPLTGSELPATLEKILPPAAR